MRKQAILIIAISFFLASCGRMLIYSPERIKAYTSGNPGKPYKTLGKVEATYIPSGFSKKVAPGLKSYERNPEKYGNAGTHVRSYSLEAPPDLKPDYQQATRLMLDRAYDQYGDILGAVINVRYSTSVKYYAQGGTVDTNLQRMHTKARGTAICFVNRQNQCIIYDDSESNTKKTAQKAASSDNDSFIQVIDDEDERKPAVRIAKPEKALVPNSLLGYPLKEARTDSHYPNIKEFKKAYEYNYGKFFIRIIEFKTVIGATNYLSFLSQQPKAKKINTGFFWTTVQEGCNKCANLSFLFDQTKVIAIFPEDQTLSTAVKVSHALEKK
ncbi:MAG: hypothetical protein PHN19_00760 [Patescibacteria group bacterium]|nr:hypothetical protein [Patescibacteria group bacterium]